MRKLSIKSRKRWPETAVAKPRLIPVTSKKAAYAGESSPLPLEKRR